MAKLAAYGAILKKGATTIAQVKTISGPGLSVDTIDVSTHDSASAYREFIAGLIDGGEVTFELEFDPANATHGTLLTDLAARTPNSYNVTFPGGGASDLWTFNGIVTKFTPSAAVDGDLSANCTIKLTGAVTIA